MFHFQKYGVGGKWSVGDETYVLKKTKVCMIAGV
jgi:hypothetical protein